MKTMPLTWCFDTDVFKLKGSQYDAQNVRMAFSFNLNMTACRNFESDLQCTGSRKFENALAKKQIIILSNRQRFDSENYESETPIIKESHMQWIKMPSTQTLWHYEVELSQITREDNLVMAIEDLTEVQEPFYEMKSKKMSIELLFFPT